MNISFLSEKGNKYLIYVLVGVLILVVLLPANSVSDTKERIAIQETNADEDLEGQLKRVLSAMEGVGNVEVMITRETSQTGLFGNEGDSLKVSGVVVVAQGAGNATVNARISEVVKALFSVDAHKISIVKMRSQEGDR
ncbi:MAG: hypothetical protein IJD24_03505 [Agathobacter sp.]|nr:hypothetical protein [Agathobacter sp.]